ncbi:MAG TPA: ThuA domain-containing protein [Longimicrobiales bacterium]|nr:ThuA domain-containing protein [Longimicrobiales bacterium]
MALRAALLLASLATGLAPALANAQESPSPANPHRIDFEGTVGPGAGKYIVFLAGDHEYRSEETLPALARIMARHYGFRTSVFFTTDAESGFIEPGSSHIAGLDALQSADLLVIFTRFQDFPDEEMRHIVAYLDRGGPVVGFRTATHAFQINRQDAAYREFSWRAGDPMPGGFGRQILGETWVSHYGPNHTTSSRIVVEPSQRDHPILRGVTTAWAQSGVYFVDPIEGSTILARGQVLDGMSPDAPPSQQRADLVPVAWVRQYTRPNGASGRVFTTTHGASEDLLDDGFRRMVVNGILWATGLDDAISPDGPIDFVGPYNPTRFDFDGFVQGLKPSDMAGWDSPIPGPGSR